MQYWHNDAFPWENIFEYHHEILPYFLNFQILN